MFKKNKNRETDSKKLRKNRSGIVVFDNNADLFNLFTKRDYFSEEGDSSVIIPNCNCDSAADPTLHDRSHSCENQYSDWSEEQEVGIKRAGEPRRDRHGLPFLDGGGSLSRMFTDAAAAKEGENFPELIENLLKGKGKDAMLREKSDRPPPEPLPLKKRLKRYPPPQEELDLHGYTAKEAESRTESYLRSCWRNGLFTVQIIVGRGIHSPYGAVLPDVIEDLLIRLKRDGLLLWFEWDRRTKSQSGAAIAYLKQ